jgi:hypothetical protein
MQPLRATVLILFGLSLSPIALGDAISQRVTSLKSSLNLDEKQTQELTKIYREADEKAMTLRKQLQEVNKNKKAKMDAILTPEQKKKYQESSTPSLPPEAEPPQPMPTDNQQ